MRLRVDPKWNHERHQKIKTRYDMNLVAGAIGLVRLGATDSLGRIPLRLIRV